MKITKYYPPPRWGRIEVGVDIVCSPSPSPSPLRARLRPGRAHAPEGGSSKTEAAGGEGIIGPFSK